MKLNSIAPAVFAIGLWSSVTVTVTSAEEEYTTAQCAKFGLLGFDIFAYDRYESFFNEDSTVTLAQSGTYKGPKNIEEYVRFADATSPLIASAKDLGDAGIFPSGFDPVEGTCKFTVYKAQSTTLSNDLSTNGDTINLLALRSVVYSIPKNIITVVRVYYTFKFLEAFFTRVATAPVFNFICDTLTGPSCVEVLPGDPDSFPTKKQCVKRLSELPIFEGTDGYFDSNNQGCRIVHAVFAATNSDHCAHISLDPAEDSKGNIKCQVSENVAVMDLFTADEIAAHKQVCADSPYVDDDCIRVIPNPNPKTSKNQKSKESKSSKESKRN